MDEYDLKKEQEKYKKYISEWSQLIRKFKRPPIEGAISDTHFITLNGFMNKANDHLYAANIALNFGYSHSLAVQCRVRIELNARHEIYTNCFFLDTEEDLIQFQEYILADLNRVIEGSLRSKPETACLIPETKENLLKYNLSLIDEIKPNYSKSRHTRKKKRIQYSPDFSYTHETLKKFIKENKDHFSTKEKDTSYLTTKSAGVTSSYKMLSESFVHPNLETLKNQQIIGGVFVTDDARKTEIFNLLLFNSKIRWCIETAKILIEINNKYGSKHLDKKTFLQIYESKLHIEPEINKIRNDISNIIKDTHKFYEREFTPFTLSSDSLSDEQLFIHKFYMHSVSVLGLENQYNFPAACVELSVMEEMLRKIETHNKKLDLPSDFFAMFKHPMLAHSNYDIRSGGVIYDSINQV